MGRGDRYERRSSRRGSFAFVVVPVVLVACGVVTFFIVTSLLPSDASSIGSPSATPSVSRPAGGGVPEDQHPTAGPVTGDGAAHPFVTNVIASDDGTSVTVYSFVPGVAETGGTCTARVSISGQSRDIAGQAAIQVATTTCPPLVVSLVGLPHGTASLTVDYRSATTSGRSVATKVEVP
jgi:hypothetical protein